ncbi:purine and uridine phosphorylase [Hypoxylon cercidicola]|nr:purine and uridine phosphorylase [Hypoxylon cercidicola]
MTTESRTHNDYTVGWVCALPKEQTAATAMLDQRHADLPKPPNDHNTYTLGSIGKHNIVIACLPKGKIGTTPATTVALQMISTFSSIKFGLMVGIGGGIPPKVRLGDVVVSVPVDRHPGVVQWDLGRTEQGHKFERTGALNNPPTLLLTALTKVETEHELTGSRIPDYLEELKEKWPRLVSKYLRSDSLEDILFKADYDHVSGNDEEGEEEEEGEEGESCRYCDKTKVVKMKPRDMRVHYGLIASGNSVIKDSTFRDKLRRDLDGAVLCVEMEAAGLMDNFPCIVIRGICDYADSHKNKAWQEHAAAVAAAFAKELLGYVPFDGVAQERSVKDVVGRVYEKVKEIKGEVVQVRSRLRRQEDLEVLEWLTPIDYGLQQTDYLRRRQPGTGEWLLDSENYHNWIKGLNQKLFLPGIPGAGKTILTSIVVDDLDQKFNTEISAGTIGIAYIYCNFKRKHEQKIEDLISSLLKQFLQSRPSLPLDVRDLYDDHIRKRTRPTLHRLLVILKAVIATHVKTFIIIDALDECQTSDDCRKRLLSEIFNLQKEAKANILATSRFIPEVTETFEGSIISEVRASKDGLHKYLGGRMSQLPQCVDRRPDLQNEITTTITEAVDGM